MGIVFSLIPVVVLLLFAWFGVRQGIYRGLMALAGPLLGAITIDLWRDVLIQRWVDNPPLLISVMLAIFLLIVLLIGYGGTLLFASPVLDDSIDDLRSLILSGMVGLLNGLLVLSYMLRYINDFFASSTLGRLIEATVITRTLRDWLPWFMVAVLLTAGGAVLVRVVQRMQGGGDEVPTSVADAIKQAPRTKVTDPETRERLQTVSKKIRQRLGDY